MYKAESANLVDDMEAVAQSGLELDERVVERAELRRRQRQVLHAPACVARRECRLRELYLRANQMESRLVDANPLF